MPASSRPSDSSSGNLRIAPFRGLPRKASATAAALPLLPLETGARIAYT